MNGFIYMDFPRATLYLGWSNIILPVFCEWTRDCYVVCCCKCNTSSFFGNELGIVTLFIVVNRTWFKWHQLKRFDRSATSCFPRLRSCRPQTHPHASRWHRSQRSRKQQSRTSLSRRDSYNKSRKSSFWAQKTAQAMDVAWIILKVWTHKSEFIDEISKIQHACLPFVLGTSSSKRTSWTGNQSWLS